MGTVPSPEHCITLSVFACTLGPRDVPAVKQCVLQVGLLLLRTIMKILPGMLLPKRPGRMWDERSSGRSLRSSVLGLEIWAVACAASF